MDELVSHLSCGVCHPSALTGYAKVSQRHNACAKHAADAHDVELVERSQKSGSSVHTSGLEAKALPKSSTALRELFANLRWVPLIVDVGDRPADVYAIRLCVQ